MIKIEDLKLSQMVLRFQIVVVTKRGRQFTVVREGEAAFYAYNQTEFGTSGRKLFPTFENMVLHLKGL